MSRLQIGVIGSERCSRQAYETARAVGELVAKHGAVLVTGGLGGVMEAACVGAAEAGGVTVGVLPSDRRESANRGCGIVIATGIGRARNAVVANSVDGLIVIEGGTGTLSEMCFAYERVPLVAITSCGGVAKQYANRWLDGRRIRRIEAALSPGEALEKLLRLIEGKA